MQAGCTPTTCHLNSLDFVTKSIYTSSVITDKGTRKCKYTGTFHSCCLYMNFVLKTLKMLIGKYCLLDIGYFYLISGTLQTSNIFGHSFNILIMWKVGPSFYIDTSFSIQKCPIILCPELSFLLHSHLHLCQPGVIKISSKDAHTKIVLILSHF